jgi:hypothetical protein
MPVSHSTAYRRAAVERFPEDIARVLTQGHVYWYTDRERPQCYQFDSRGVHSVHYNISADRNEPVGHHFEFPWKMSAGVSEKSTNATGVKALVLPIKNGRMLPVVYWSRGNRVDWIFPIGTEIHELLMQRYNGKYYVYESRRKIRTKDSWAASILLPFTSQAEFEKAIGYGLGKLPVEDTTLIDTRHRGVGFKVRAANFRLPRVSTVLVESALRDAQFTEVEHREWPVTQGVQDFHIVPRLFTGMHAGATTDSCARCHHCST